MTNAANTGPDRTGEAVPPGRQIDAIGRNVPVSKPKSGHVGPKIAPARLLAAAIAEQWTPAYTTEYLTAIAQGRDPAAVVGVPGTPPDWTTRRWAVGELLNRSVGKVKAHVVLEGGIDVKGSIDVKVATFALDARDIDLALPQDQLEAFRDAQRKLVQRAKAKVAALTGPAVIDAESSEVVDSE